jgi:MraZ protein
MGNFLLGSYPARIGKSGRIKIPEKFRTTIEELYGKELFITSLSDQAVQIYPLPVWEELAGITKTGLVHLKPDVKMFMRRVNLKGGQHEIDLKGRVLINPVLREKTQLEEDVEVIGLNNHLEVWNRDLLNKLLDKNPLTDEDFEQISNLANKVKTE